MIDAAQIEERLDNLKPELRKARKRAAELEYQDASLTGILKVLTNLGPGPRHGPSYSCEKSGYRAYPEEYMTEGFVGPSVPFSELDTAECPRCREQHPIFKRELQIHGSPHGDTWEKVTFLICERDLVMPQLDRKTWDA